MFAIAILIICAVILQFTIMWERFETTNLILSGAMLLSFIAGFGYML